MFYYQIAETTIKSEYRLPSFESFACENCRTDIILEKTSESPPAGEDRVSGTIVHRRLPDGWFFHPASTDRAGLYTNEDYTRLKVLGETHDTVSYMAEWFARIAIECYLARRGYVSLHAAAVEADGEAYAFTGSSGLGKSTRANAWIEEVNAKLINGDRPLIDVRRRRLYGVPWDGKEQCFRKVQYPLKVIFEVRRSESVYVRNMSFSQRRKLLMRQCFIPMWDTETASIQIANITRLAANAEIVRAFCGPDRKAAGALKKTIQEHVFLKEEQDMKAKEGFVLRHIVDEYMLMPTGENIGIFNGTVLLNEVSAFVWEKLQQPVSKADLLQAVLDEYEVDKAVASADLDALIETLKGYGVIEDD